MDANEPKRKPHYADHRKRLKERFMKAPEAVHDAEVIELLLGYVIPRRDVKPQAKDILATAKSIDDIFESDFSAIKGLGPETITFFSVLHEFINRIDYNKIHNKQIVDLSLSDAVYKFLKTKIGQSSNETFAILFLDAKNRLKSCKIVRSGFINSVAISARDVIESAIANNATSVIIAHNHPSGDPAPSKSDLDVTRQICMALRYTGITLIDHMIISYHSYYSMNAYGDIARFNAEIDKVMKNK
jgi:DNA repair protein RadC